MTATGASSDFRPFEMGYVAGSCGLFRSDRKSTPTPPLLPLFTAGTGGPQRTVWSGACRRRVSAMPHIRYRGPPMMLSNMRENGVRSLSVTCEVCRGVAPSECYACNQFARSYERDSTVNLVRQDPLRPVPYNKRWNGLFGLAPRCSAARSGVPWRSSGTARHGGGTLIIASFSPPPARDRASAPARPR
jgi:hypothetical protein